MRTGYWNRAATQWAKLGCPYEQALAEAESGHEQPLRHALTILHNLGATPAARLVTRQLRQLGARQITRGPRPTTRANPANLTSRQLEVLALLADKLTNREIAERLFLSPKTVDHHVTAILRKLDAHTRKQACTRASELGILH
jgi:DNA-binding NarL/FixJ family response regulator